MVKLVPEPVFVIPSGARVKVHIPVAGKPFRTTLPVTTSHVGWLMVLTMGADGLVFTVRVKVAVAAAHGVPNGLLVVTVMITVLPASPAEGV